MDIRDAFEAFKKGIQAFDSKKSDNSALDLAFWNVKTRILEDVKGRIDRLEELEEEKTGREYASSRLLEVVGTNIKDKGGWGGSAAGSAETVSYKIGERAQSIVDAANAFEQQAATLAKDIKKHRRDTAVTAGKALTNEEWETWINKRAKELGMGPTIFWQPINRKMDVNQLQQHLEDTIAEVSKEKENAKSIVSESIELKNFENVLTRVIEGGIQPAELYEVLSDTGKAEIKARIDGAIKDSDGDLRDGPAPLQLIYRGIDENPVGPDEGMRREPLPGELDRDDLVSGADDLTESERIREGLDTEDTEDTFAEGYGDYREDEKQRTLAEQQAITTEQDLERQRRSPAIIGSEDGDEELEEDKDESEGDPDELTPAAMQYIVENFGSVEFFYTRDDMQIDTNGDGTKDTNIIEWIINEEEENPDVIWGLFQQTDWFAENGPAARQFQMDWAKADGTFDWTPQYEVGSGTWNMTPDMEELLDDTYDSLILEASRLGINTDDPDKKNAIMQMAYNAKQLNMTDFEIKNEFATGFKGAFDINKVQGSGTFLNIKQQLRQNAATYMMKLDDATLNDYAQKIYLGKATYDGINAGHAQSVMDQEPALKSLVEQGYTPSAYFSSYSNVASELLGRPVDFLGGDSKLYSHLKDTMVANDGLNRPMTRGEFERYVRSTPEWDTSENARDEAYGTVGTLLNSFGIRV